MPRLRLPKYMEISQEIEAQIKSGALAEGRMPSVRYIADEHGVSIVTAARALRVLGDRGLIRTVERSGCFVTTPTEMAKERWALCQRVTFGPWQRLAASLFEQGFEQVASQQGTLVSRDVLILHEETSQRSLRRQV